VLATLLSLAGMVLEQARRIEAWFLIPVAYFPVAIFLLRISDVTISTLRTFAVARGRRMSAWILGFLQALLFVTAASVMLANMDQILNLLAFAAGSATGSVVGVIIEGLLAPGHSLIRMYSPGQGEALAEELRKLGYGATLVSGKGLGGTVSLIYSYVPRRKVPKIKKQVIMHDPDAYISVENVRQLRGGWRA
jgi:uncharacterized protein YebE (UPF0316 family)